MDNHPPASPTRLLSVKHRQQLLCTARQSIRHGLNHSDCYAVEHNGLPTPLLEQRASFVSLFIDQQLRGCIGNLHPYEALIDNVAHNANSAAFNDYRFSPVNEQEFPQLTIHIAILSATSPIQFNDEADLFSQLRPGIDGLVLETDEHKATFLPAVWKQLPSPGQFLKQLKKKAGLDENYWHTDMRVERYTVEEFAENS